MPKKKKNAIEEDELNVNQIEIDISKIKPNPSNPRIIKDDRFEKLVKSIKDFPKMMELRPIIVDSNNMILGGNMRLKALNYLSYKKIPKSWIKQASDLTDKEKEQFIIKDNVGFGDWDWDMLANEWNSEELEAWGLDIPSFEVDDNEVDIKDLFDIELPFYTPSEIQPDINELANLDKTKQLIEKIDTLEVDNKLKEILKIRASFFTDFNFQKIADYFHKENPKVQEIFKDLGLVILAPKEALERGFINLKENIEDL